MATRRAFALNATTATLTPLGSDAAGLAFTFVMDGTLTGITWDGVAMTPVVGATPVNYFGFNVYLHRIEGIDVDSPVNVTASGTGGFRIVFAIAVDGANQTDCVAAASPGGEVGTDTTPSIGITAEVGQLLFAWMSASPDAGAIPTELHTLINGLQDPINGGYWSLQEKVAASTSESLGWTMGASPWGGIAVAVADAEGGEDPTPVGRSFSVATEALVAVEAESSAGGEILGDAGATFGLPTEALLAVAATHSAAGEGLVSSANAVALSTEALVAASSSRLVPNEALLAVGASRSAPGEGLAGSGASFAAPTEVVLVVSAARPIPTELLLANLAAAEVPTEVLLGVERTIALPTELVAGATSGRTIPTEAILSIEEAIPLPTEALLDVSAARAPPTEALLAAGVAFELPTEALRAVGSSLDAPTELLAAEEPFTWTIAGESLLRVSRAFPVPSEALPAPTEDATFTLTGSDEPFEDAVVLATTPPTAEFDLDAAGPAFADAVVLATTPPAAAFELAVSDPAFTDSVAVSVGGAVLLVLAGSDEPFEDAVVLATTPPAVGVDLDAADPAFEDALALVGTPPATFPLVGADPAFTDALGIEVGPPTATIVLAVSDLAFTDALGIDAGSSGATFELSGSDPGFSDTLALRGPASGLPAAFPAGPWPHVVSIFAPGGSAAPRPFEAPPSGWTQDPATGQMVAASGGGGSPLFPGTLVYRGPGDAQDEGRALRRQLPDGSWTVDSAVVYVRNEAILREVETGMLAEIRWASWEGGGVSLGKIMKVRRLDGLFTVRWLQSGEEIP